MKPKLIECLNQINREFYSTFAESFSKTRPESARELERILPYIADGASVLDVGCGNGRVAAFLARHRRDVTYIGMDASAEQISSSKSQFLRGLDATFFLADITQPDWMHALSLSKAGDPLALRFREALHEPSIRIFDCVLMLAVLHHIPGGEVRVRIMRQVRKLLAPRGRVVISTWQFLDNERMRKKIVPWSTVGGIDEQELEPGDALLNWKRDGLGLRYCHWIGEDELRSLAAKANLQIAETFRVGGREGDLSLYAILFA